MAPAIALPAPTIEAPLPTQRASNAPVLNERRGAPTPRQNSTAPAARSNEAVRLAPVGVRRAPGGETSTLEKSTPDTPALVKTAPIRDPRLPAGRSLDENTETDREHLAQLRKERFRRRAAESARKEIEGMADNLREQLGRQVSARRKAEGVAAELVSRASLENQIDQERDRLRSQKIRQLEQRRTLLEREVKTLTQRLVQERAKRKQLEDEKAALAKKVVDARQGTTSGTDLAALKAKVSDLQRKLNAAEWARKLAEAQLRVVTGKNESAPATTRGQSN